MSWPDANRSCPACHPVAGGHATDGADASPGARTARPGIRRA
ncbi:hypothetical protein ACFPM0_18075 [Pseudonocardia sulfidoxydans]